jgi:hypothetical protein
VLVSILGRYWENDGTLPKSSPQTVAVLCSELTTVVSFNTTAVSLETLRNVLLELDALRASGLALRGAFWVALLPACVTVRFLPLVVRPVRV